MDRPDQGSEVRTRLPAGGRWIRTIGTPQNFCGCWQFLTNIAGSARDLRLVWRKGSGSGSHPTRRWREMDSNPRSPREDCQRPVMRGQVRTRLAAGGRWIRTIGTRQIFSGARRSPRKFIFRNINRLPRASRILARADIAVRNSLMVLFQFPVTAE